MSTILQIIQIVSAILLIIAVLIQSSGAGMGSAFGGDSAVYRTKRGAQKTIFIATIVLAIIFLGSTLAELFI